MFRKIFRFFYRVKVTDRYIKYKVFGITVGRSKNKKRIKECEERAKHNLYVNSMYKALCVYNQHQKIFPKYENLYYNKDIVLVATGPTLKDYIPIKGAIHVGVNKAFKIEKIKFDYLFAQDYGIKDYVEDFCLYDSVKFMGMLPMEFSSCIIPKSISLRYDIQRYYTSYVEELDFPTYDISSVAFWDSYSIVFSAMQFILWTNPKKVYLVGCDCSLDGYHNEATKNSLYLEKVLEGWSKLKEFISIYYPETEVISINPIGLKGLFNDRYTK